MSILDDAMEEHMAYIVLSLDRPFSFKDFLSFKAGETEKEHRITHGTFRNKISKFRKAGIVESSFYSGCAFYTLKGHPFTKAMTPDHTGAPASNSNKFHRMLQSLPLDTQSIHNIRLRFTAPGIWTSASVSNFYNNSNKDILIPSWSREGALVKVTIHKTDVVSVIVSCSLRPIALDFNGIIAFFTLLATTEERLRSLLSLPSNGNRVTIPDYKTWIITMWHFGRDSLTEFAGEKFSITVEDAMHGLTRIYSKTFATIKGNNRERRNKTRVRLETQQYPNTTVLHALQLDNP